MRFRTHQEKRLREGGVEPRLLTLAGHKGKRLHMEGVGPEMRSPVGLMARILPASRRLLQSGIGLSGATQRADGFVLQRPAHWR